MSRIKALYQYLSEKGKHRGLTSNSQIMASECDLHDLSTKIKDLPGITTIATAREPHVFRYNEELDAIEGRQIRIYNQHYPEFIILDYNEKVYLARLNDSKCDIVKCSPDESSFMNDMFELLDRDEKPILHHREFSDVTEYLNNYLKEYEYPFDLEETTEEVDINGLIQ